jgi:hypothetical protein
MARRMAALMASQRARLPEGRRTIFSKGNRLESVRECGLSPIPVDHAGKWILTMCVRLRRISIGRLD